MGQKKKEQKPQSQSSEPNKPVSGEMHSFETSRSLQNSLKSKSSKDRSLFFNFGNLFFWGSVLRFGFLLLNEAFDISTDIDYHVYTEGAMEALKKDGNPYSRGTYRYTPLIAYLMVPNLTIPWFGKALFNLFDLLAIFYMDLYLKKVQGLGEAERYKALAFWALNPFMAYINGRGSCESVALLLFAMMLYHVRLVHDKVAERVNSLLGGLFYGLLIHFRLYPVIFALSLYIYINRQKFWPRLNIWIFGLTAIAVNVALIAFFYQMYGEVFLDECFLYHLRRKDPRHNYSIFWINTVYDYFHQPEGFSIIDSGNLLMALRLSLIALAAFSFGRKYLYALLVQTFIFTSFNTVYTAQYAVWETQLLPYVLADTKCYQKEKKWAFWGLVLCWFVMMEVWAVFSGAFEHRGLNTQYYMHVANLGYFLIRVLFIHFVIDNRKEEFIL